MPRPWRASVRRGRAGGASRGRSHAAHKGVPRRGAAPLAVAVVAGGFLGPILLVAGLQRTPAATASFILNTEPVATAVLAALFFGEHLGRHVVRGTALVVVAGGLLAGSGSPELRLGAVFVVAACICWGLDNCVTAELDTLAPEHVTLAKGVIAGGTSLVLGLVTGGTLPDQGDTVVALMAGARLWPLDHPVGARRPRPGCRTRTARLLGGAVRRGRGRLVGVPDPVRTVEVVALVLAAFGVSQVLWSTHVHEHAHEPLLHEHEHEHDEHHQHHDELVLGRHPHLHRHERLVHAHPHVPDLHHRHAH